jgi:hypothetical protein
MISSQSSTSFEPVSKLSIICQIKIDLLPKPPCKLRQISKCVQTDFPQPSSSNPPATPYPNAVHDRSCPDDDDNSAEARQREVDRQENVRKTLTIIEDALGY